MRHFRSIHYLRAVAAIMVAVSHIFSNVKFMQESLSQVFWLRGGVDIFFVISGFVMVQSTANRAISPTQFMGQRALRIVPMYWIATLAVMMQIDGEWAFKLQSFFFIPALNPESGMWQPVLEPGWTLNYEMFFYAIFASTLLLKESLRFPVLALGFCAFALFGHMTMSTAATGFYARPIIMEFILGMAIARFGIRLPAVFAVAGFTAMFVFQFAPVDRLYSLGIPAALIVASALNYEDRLPNWKLADFLGSASYSIYLFHLIALGFVVKFWPDAQSSPALFVIISTGFMLATGCSIYWAIERPILALVTRMKKRPSDPLLAPV